MNKIITILVLHAVITCISSNTFNGDTALCGEYIPKVLSAVCNRKYFDPKTKKASSEDWDLLSGSNFLDNDNSMISAYYNYVRFVDELGKNERNEPNLDLVFPFKSRKNAYGMAKSRFRRESVGIVEECCDKICSMKELLSYCG